ncbi:MAG TPA: PAS domain S-box protein, partial [Candidatus Thermoplasmatota archaeon]|nr:PAS domain S-box protein [Candidatus Thermoplasmatota archaeon]
VFAVGPHGRLTAMNPAAETLLGWRFADLQGRPIDDFLQCRLLVPGSGPQPRAIAADVLTAATTRREEEALLIRKDGSAFYATYVASPILREGDVWGAVVVFRDITARKQAEEAVRRLAAIVTASDDAIVSFALDGTILSWNPRAEQIFGARAEDAIGKPGKLVLPPQFHADLDALLERPTNGGGPLQHMARRLEREGAVAYLSMTATHVLDANGNAVALAWVAEDVTQAAIRDEAIRRSEERYRLLLDSVTEHAIFELDPRGFVTTWNPAAERIKKWKAEEIIGWHFSVLFPPEEVANGDPWMELDKAKEDGQYTAEVRRIRKSGEIFDASVTLSAMRDPAGELVGFVKVTRDVSERKEWERKLETRDEYYRAFFEALEAPSAWCDPSGQIVRANRAFREGVGISAEDLVGRTLVSLCEDASRDAAIPAIQAVKDGQAARVAFTAVGPSGKQLERIWHLQPILREGVATGFFAVGEPMAGRHR